jgi:biofilm PGA synthesis N-glycosyltransferase PgaC
VATLLNLRIAASMHDKSASDIFYALLFVPAELYMWVRMGHFVTAWVQFFARSEKDNWAAQAAAERGRGSAYVMPAVCAVATFAVLIYAWSQQSVAVQSAILSIGWPVLYLITVLQTIFMVKKVLRRQRGFTV